VKALAAIGALCAALVGYAAWVARGFFKDFR
jgi:hypothetical protein